MNMGMSPLKKTLVRKTMAITEDFSITMVRRVDIELMEREVIRAKGTAPFTRPETPMISSSQQLTRQLFLQQGQKRRLVRAMLMNLAKKMPAIPRRTKVQDMAIFFWLSLNSQAETPTIRKSSPSATCETVLDANLEVSSPFLLMLQMLKCDRKIPVTISDTIPENSRYSDVRQEMNPHRKVSPSSVTPSFSTTNLQYLNIRVSSSPQKVPMRIDTVTTIRKFPKMSKGQDQTKLKSTEVPELLDTKMTILLNNTIVTTSFIRDSPNMIENNFGWTQGLMVERAATGSILHMVAAKRIISQVLRVTTTLMSTRSLMRLRQLARQSSPKMVRKLKRVPRIPQMFIQKIFWKNLRFLRLKLSEKSIRGSRTKNTMF